MAAKSLVPQSGAAIDAINTNQPIIWPVFCGVLVFNRSTETRKAPMPPPTEKVTKTVTGIGLPTFDTVKSTCSDVATSHVAITAITPRVVAIAKGLIRFLAVRRTPFHS